MKSDQPTNRNGRKRVKWLPRTGTREFNDVLAQALNRHADLPRLEKAEAMVDSIIAQSTLAWPLTSYGSGC
jgi:hypothetical protein